MLTIATDAVDIPMLSATGTAGSTTFLRGDNTWATAGSTSASDLTSGTLADARFPATLPSISGANLTNLPITPAGTADFVAYGELPNGSPVVLKSDGTVTTAAPTVIISAESIPSGSVATAMTGLAFDLHAAFDPNTSNKFVMTYALSGGNGTAVVGTVSGTTITFGTPVAYLTGTAGHPKVAFDPSTAGQFVVLYKDSTNSNYGTAMVGTVSGTSVTFGAKVVFNSADTMPLVLAFDPSTAGKFIISYADNSAASSSTLVGTISGTSLTFGTGVVFKTAVLWNCDGAFDPNTAGNFVLTYYGASNFGTVSVGTVSGTSLSFGSPTVFKSNQVMRISIAFDPNTAGKFVLAYQHKGNSDYGTAMVGTVSGTSATFGTDVVFYAAETGWCSVAFDPNTTNKFVISYYNDSSYAAFTIVGTVSGTTLSFGSANTLSITTQYQTSIMFDPTTAGKFVIGFADQATGNSGKAFMGQLAVSSTGSSTNLTATNFLGTSTAAYNGNQTATVMLQGGVSTNQTGLTVGSTYYVQTDGTLSTTAGTPSVEAGKALSATSLFLSDTADPAVALNTAKVTNSTSASDLASGTLPDTVFPATLPAISGANLTNLPASASDFTSITEGANTGYGTSERSANPDNYGNIGDLAIDLSYSHGSSTTRGATGEYSTALGRNTIASGLNSFTTGFSNTASGNYSIAMGANTSVSGQYSIVMGSYTSANGNYSIAMGRQTTAHGQVSIASGYDSVASGETSVAMGKGPTASGRYGIAMGKLTTASGDTSTAFGNSTISNSVVSTAMGWGTTASGWGSTSMGKNTIASGNYSVAMGEVTTASGAFSVAACKSSTASGDYSFAMNSSTTASGWGATAMGHTVVSSGSLSVAMGSATTNAGQNSLVVGKNGGIGTANTTLLGVAYSTTATGNITATTADTNLVFKVSTAGDGYFDGAADLGNADYAEYFESADGSVLERGHFVSFAQGSECVEYGNSELVGIVSATPAIVGDSQSLHYTGKYKKDEFGAYIRESVTVTDELHNFSIYEQLPESTYDVDGELLPLGLSTWSVSIDDSFESDMETFLLEVKNKKTQEVLETITDRSTLGDVRTYGFEVDVYGTYVHTLIDKVLSEDFDPTQEYIPRSDRPEWSPIGLLGKLWVHLATGEAIATGDYVTSDSEGKAIKCLRADTDSFRVISINSERNLVRVLYK